MNKSGLNVALVGFANCGKTTLFNALTGAKQKTANWSGVTVAKKQHEVNVGKYLLTLTDLPGIPSLSKREQQSQDIAITQEHFAQTDVDCIVNVIDATQLQRQLYLTAQLLELGIPMIVVLNKSDRQQANHIDAGLLSKLLTYPVLEGSALQPEQLKQKLTLALQSIPAVATDFKVLNDESFDESINSGSTSELALKTSTENGEQEIGAMQLRYQFVENIIAQVVQPKSATTSFTDRLDHIILHPIAGIPIFLGMMYLLFMFAINFSSAFIDFFDITAGALFVTYPTYLLAQFNLPDWLIVLIEGVGSGLQTVATFIPVIVCLFIGLSLLENSGYLARAAFVVDSLMQKLGLPGKAFVPLIVGFGCTVPAVMSARVLDSERERITTVMMTPFMSCGARLPVYALFAAAFFPDSGQNLVFLLYLIGIAAAILTGFLLKSTILPGTNSANIMELPLYEWPTISHLINRVWQRTKSFLAGAGQTIVVVVCILTFFNSLGTDGEFGHQGSGSSILSETAQIMTPVFAPLGVKDDNWQASVGIITGIFAKEALVATFNSLYSTSQPEEQGSPNWGEIWQEAVASINHNIRGIAPADPLSVDVGDVSSLTAAAAEQEVEVSTYLAMRHAFNGQVGAFSYLLFILLYTPCIAAMGAIKSEVGNRWAGFAALWSFTLAYLVATLVYQAALLSETPLISISMIALVLLVFALIYLWLKLLGNRILTIPVTVKY